MEYIKAFEARWADIDINGHMRHTAYNDYAAHVRLKFFDEQGYPTTEFIKKGIGPVLFREETQFKAEIKMSETFTVDCELIAARPSAKIIKLRHTIKNHEGKTAAIIQVDLGWMDLHARKAIKPPEELARVIFTLNKSSDFETLDGQ